MAKVFAQNVTEIAVIQAIQGTIPAVAVWHMYSEEETGFDDAELVRDFANNWQDHVMDVVTNAVTLIGFEWRSLDPQDSNVGYVDPDPTKPTIGLDTSAAVPPNVALLVKKGTTNRPRGKRDGRMFLPGIAEQHVDNAGNVDLTVKDVFDAQFQLFLDGISNDGGNLAPVMYPVVLETTPASRVPGPNEVTLNYRRVTSLTTDRRVATQRDRLR